MHARRGMDTALAAIAPATVQLASGRSRESPGTAPRSRHYRYHYFKSLVKSRRGNPELHERARASLRAVASIALRRFSTILRGEPRAPCARTKIRGRRPHFRSHPLARFWIVGESIWLWPLKRVRRSSGTAIAISAENTRLAPLASPAASVRACRLEDIRDAGSHAHS